MTFLQCELNMKVTQKVVFSDAEIITICPVHVRLVRMYGPQHTVKLYDKKCVILHQSLKYFLYNAENIIRII